MQWFGLKPQDVAQCFNNQYLPDLVFVLAPPYEGKKRPL